MDFSVSSPIAYSVTQVNEFIKDLMEGHPALSNILIRGEISNFKNHYASGHLYFSLKDENSVLRCIMFRFNAYGLKFMPQEGMQVIAHGKLSLYLKDGSYSLNVDSLQPDGIGSLALAFEQLKKRLESEGLFEPSRKKPIPKFPHTVGIITSASGAALRDIIQISRRRYPLAKLLIYPALVQGNDAPLSMIRALSWFNDCNACDVIILGRGGGSLEDLWCFNDEGLARAIARSHIPVVSAVGHETDFSISDFVADLRAPTPSAAAELILPDSLEWKRNLRLLQTRLETILLSVIKHHRQHISLLSQSHYLQKPSNYLDMKRLEVDRMSDRLLSSFAYRIQNKKQQLAVLSEKMNALSPLAVLGRGYSITYDRQEEIVTSSHKLQPKDRISVLFSDGIAEATVLGVSHFSSKDENSKEIIHHER